MEPWIWRNVVLIPLKFFHKNWKNNFFMDVALVAFKLQRAFPKLLPQSWKYTVEISLKAFAFNI